MEVSSVLPLCSPNGRGEVVGNEEGEKMGETRKPAHRLPSKDRSLALDI
jgi:hypothetical protein